MSGNPYLKLASTGIGFQEELGQQTSSGATAGDIVALNSSAQIDASLLPAISASYVPAVQTSNFAAAYSYLELVDLATAAANVTATLPDATAYAGQGLIVMPITVSTGHSVIFATTSSQTVNGAAVSGLPHLSKVNQTYFFISDGSNWWTISPLTNLASDVTGTLLAANGGTGSSAAPTNGQVLLGDTATGQYVAATVGSSDSTISFTTGAGSLTIQVNQTNLALSSIGGLLNLASQVSGVLPVLNSSGVVTATAGSTNITAGALIYLDSSSLIQLADNSVPQIATGFAPAAITASTSGKVIMGNGPNTGVTGLTAGTAYLLGTAGGITTVVPSGSGDAVQPVGVALSSTELFVQLGLPTYRA